LQIKSAILIFWGLEIDENRGTLMIQRKKERKKERRRILGKKCKKQS